MTKGKGIVKVNGTPLELVQPEVLRFKLFEPILLLGKDKFQGIDIRVRVRGGGPVAQVFAIRQVIAKSVIAWFQKCAYNIFFVGEYIVFLTMKQTSMKRPSESSRQS